MPALQTQFEVPTSQLCRWSSAEVQQEEEGVDLTSYAVLSILHDIYKIGILSYPYITFISSSRRVTRQIMDSILSKRNNVYGKKLSCHVLSPSNSNPVLKGEEWE